MLPVHQDTLHAASLLPWEAQTSTTTAASETDVLSRTRPTRIETTSDKQTNDKEKNNDGANGARKGGAERGEDRDTEAWAGRNLDTNVGMPKSREQAQPARPGAVSWRQGASARFLEVWRAFLEHEDARKDSQYDTIRQMYERVIVGVGNRARERTTEGQ